MNSHHILRCFFRTHTAMTQNVHSHHRPGERRKKINGTKNEHTEKNVWWQKLNWCIGWNDNRVKHYVLLYIVKNVGSASVSVYVRVDRAVQTEVWIVGALRITLNHHSVKYLNWLWHMLNGTRRNVYVAQRQMLRSFPNLRAFVCSFVRPIRFVHVSIDGIFFYLAPTKRRPFSMR